MNFYKKSFSTFKKCIIFAEKYNMNATIDKHTIFKNIDLLNYKDKLRLLKYITNSLIKIEKKEKKELVENLTQAFKEMELVKRGKLEGRPVEELLNEL